MSADGQGATDERNREFWDELCGTNMAQALGITEINPASLARFDAWYLDCYPYLARYLDDLPVEGRRVLEIGLGFGTVGQSLAARGARYTGADIAAGPVAMMQDRLRWLDKANEATAVQASALELPWDDETFDAVVSIGCLHHTGDLPRAVSEVNRVLVPGGDALVMLYNAHSYRQLSQVPRRRWQESRAGRNAAESVRGMYDANTAGEAAPHTEYVSRRAARNLFKAFTAVSIEAQNFDTHRVHLGQREWWIRRERLLGRAARALGLDLYIRARK